MNNLIKRAKELLLTPNSAWEIIKNEETDIGDLLKSYVLPLALIPAVSSFIGYGFIGFDIGLFGRMAIVEWGISAALQSFISTLLSVFVIAWVIHHLAPKFECDVNLDNAAKLIGYSYTPVLIFGIFYIIPSLSILALLGGLYSLYILYLGFPIITGVSEARKSNFMIVSILVSIGAFILVSIIMGAILGTVGLGSYSSYNF